ncbi:MAG: prolyl oligopeptidase family serine peptidase [Chloroflexi bacterium]|uniref:Prolyl oligopeptidase family serine peptidase n=1 Tax=Candidatus Chlorohelix allophototropha TaxID=3003348 RepID=A0A8T7M9K4_9CHLR|nr:prolyl oligopeptidase family serine peptidase [Chloroflexota bacterium]WJW68730.1 prolyl oligopeptidase family serine peptidase [Chloroflexota bacterium L227-S17]
MKRQSIFKSKLLRLALVSLIFSLAFVYVAMSVYSALFLTVVSDRALGSLTPASYSLPYEEVAFSSPAEDKITIRGWLVPKADSPHVLILLHGQNANRSASLPISKPLWEKGFNLLLLDLRGHGQSDGERHYYGQREQYDLVGAVSYLQNRGFKAGSIGIMGWSLGASVAIMAMSQSEGIQAGVSDSGFASLGNMLGIWSPGVSLIGRLTTGLDFDKVKPEAAIKQLGQRHVFIIQGDSDRNVPPDNAYKLKEAGGANVTQFWMLAGVGHVGAYSSNPDEYIRRVTAFFATELK